MLNQFIPEDIDLVRNGQGLFSGSLLFADITGFTDISEKLSRQGKADTTELTELLDSSFERIQGIIRHLSRVVPGLARESIRVHISATAVVSS